MSNFVDKYSHIEKALSKIPEEQRAAIQDLINMLNNDGTGDHTAIIFAIINKMLSEMAEFGIDLELGMLTSEEKLSLENEIKKLIIEMQRSGKNISKEDMMRIIMSAIYKEFKKIYGDMVPKDEDSLKPVLEKKYNQGLKKQLELMIIHELNRLMTNSMLLSDTRIAEYYVNSIVYMSLKAEIERLKDQSIRKSNSIRESVDNSRDNTNNHGRNF